VVPGAVAGGLAWTVLQALGTYLAHHFLRSDVVLARRLWPHSIVQPPLTRADRAVLAAQALQNQRRDDQHVDVSYDDRPAGGEASGQAPRTPDEIAPPAQSRAGDRRD
jgi:hypothetical protein